MGSKLMWEAPDIVPSMTPGAGRPVRGRISR
jgi:hypothetical protein